MAYSKSSNPRSANYGKPKNKKPKEKPRKGKPTLEEDKDRGYISGGNRRAYLDSL